MIKLPLTISPVVTAVYAVIILAYISETAYSIIKMRYLLAHKLVKEEPAIYTFYMGVAIAGVFMAVRTVFNIWTCDDIYLIVLRVMSNGMVIYVMFTASRLLWAEKFRKLGKRLSGEREDKDEAQYRR